MANRVKDKVAIVTGAGSIGPGIGNGKASAILYAREGARVMLVDRNLDAAEETRHIIEEEGGDSFTFKADVTIPGDCKRIADKCIEVFNKIDILHNNVGIEIPGGVVETTEETWDRVMNVNLKSMFLTTKYVLPYMEKQRNGSVVNISSLNAIRTLPGCISTPYAVAKAGVIALTREIAIQYATKGIRANAILPGLMNTPLVAATIMDSYGGNIEEAMKTRDAMCTTGKQGEAWDVGYAAIFLASDEAKYINGAALLVDGGLTQIWR
jgi:NAD(P)-dependent dehydrogenase (short-subunit alcohol dehydrogenase family)